MITYNYSHPILHRLPSQKTRCPNVLLNKNVFFWSKLSEKYRNWYNFTTVSSNQIHQINYYTERTQIDKLTRAMCLMRLLVCLNTEIFKCICSFLLNEKNQISSVFLYTYIFLCINNCANKYVCVMWGHTNLRVLCFGCVIKHSYIICAMGLQYGWFSLDFNHIHYTTLHI